MYSDIPLWLSIVMIVGGLVALAWSSGVFVDGAAKVANALGISPFVVGMVIIGFGTSAPELCVSALSGLSGHANLSLGNAYGSCIFNIAVILGVSAFICPLVARPSATLVAGPGLVAISLFSMFVLRDGRCTRLDAGILLVAFAVLLPLYCWYDQRTKGASADSDVASSPGADKKGLPLAVVKVLVGLAVLVGSSHILVWGSVDLAKTLGVSDLMIGLTIVAAGTSLPELASAVASARRGEHEFVLGNIIGSNFFNMLAVVGIAGGISPIGKFSPYILTRDLPLMIGASLLILFFGVNWSNYRKPGRIVKIEGALWVVAFIAYTALMIVQEM